MKKISITILLLSCFYLGISWILLNGNIIYYTSFNESTIVDSQKEKLFVSSDLAITAEGDSLINRNNIFDIWTNKRYKIKYFGILFHWTYTNPEWRYLNIAFKDESYPYLNGWCVKGDNSEYFFQCCDGIRCVANDTITINFYKCQDKLKLGILKVAIK